MKIDGKDWVLAPVSPTREMLNEGIDPLESHPYPRSIYNAMIAAAPQPDLEAMVEGVAKVMRPDMWLFGMPSECQERARESARAVLRHLFGEG